MLSCDRIYMFILFLYCCNLFHPSTTIYWYNMYNSNISYDFCTMIIVMNNSLKINEMHFQFGWSSLCMWVNTYNTCSLLSNDIHMCTCTCTFSTSRLAHLHNSQKVEHNITRGNVFYKNDVFWPLSINV